MSVTRFVAGGAVRNDRRVLLVGCVARKASAAQPLRSLYRGQLWEARCGYADASGCPWFVLSAGVGLRAPERVYGPYDRTAADIERPECWSLVQLWRLAHALAGGRAHDLEQLRGLAVEVHAGRAYVDLLRSGGRWEAAGVQLVTPLEGLGIGSQLGWYAQRREGGQLAII